jgi:hypothetical protein
MVGDFALITATNTWESSTTMLNSHAMDENYAFAAMIRPA